MSTYYYELRVRPEKEYELFLDLLAALTNEAIEELDGTLISRSESDLSNVEFGIQKFADSLGINCQIINQKFKNEDWINKYKESIKPIEVGSFYVHPSWEEPKEDKISILIDPALTFGSGHHETTSSCLEAISKYVKEDLEVLDVGTGSGILAIGASKIGAKVDVCDTDELCVTDTASNFELNGAKFNNSWVGSAIKANKKYDIVIANIVADVLAMISKDLKKCLKEDSILILSGILDKHKSKVETKYKDLEELEVIQKNEWVTLILRNRKLDE